MCRSMKGSDLVYFVIRCAIGKKLELNRLNLGGRLFLVWFLVLFFKGGGLVDNCGKY